MALLIGGCLMSQGCVGLLVVHTQTHSFEAPIVGEKPTIGLASSPTNAITNPTAEWLRGHWGEPASVRVAATEPQAELWTYKFSHPWRGIIPCVIIPIPLVLPLESEKVTFVVRDGRVVRADISTLDFSGAGAGWLSSPEGLRFSAAAW